MKCERGVFSGDGELTRPRAAHTISETAEGALPKASYVPQARGNCCYCCHHGQRVVAQLRRQRELLHCTASPLMRAAAAAAGGAAAVAAAEASPADSSISCAAVGWHNAEPVQGYRQRRHISVHARRQSHSRARRNLRRCATAEAAVCDSGYDDVGSSSSYGLAVTLSCWRRRATCGLIRDVNSRC